MLRFNYFLFFFIILFSKELAFSQITTQGKPLYNPGKDTFSVPEIIIKAQEVKTKNLKDGFHLKDNKFAIPSDIYLDPDDYGVWREYPVFKTKVLLLALKSDGAISMNIILEDFELLPGTKLFFYNESQSQILGALTYRNNKETRVLPLSQLYGDKIFLELQVPIQWKDYGSFIISRVGIQTKTLYTTYKSPVDKWFDASQPCNYNVNCLTSSNVQFQKNAVVRILFNATGRCSGTLINTLKYNETPYVITAAHCFNTEYVANRAVFSFNYESPSCENIDGPGHSVSGASVVAAGHHGGEYDTLDFLLLKLSETIPLEYAPYYSGWDATGVIADSTYTIHHPMGDIKKISYDTDQPFTGSAGMGFDSGTHWIIKNYDIGTTEDGSSGAGLIDSENRLIGTLTGGGSPCITDIYDYYQKFSHAYSDYDNPAYQLKAWLDPENTGQLVCNGSDPSGAIIKGMADILSNFAESEIPETVRQTLGWGYLAGHNYQGNTLFAEHFKFAGSKYLYQMDFFPATVSFTNSNQTINFIIWEGGNRPGNILYQKKYSLAEFNSLAPPIDIIFDSTIFVTEEFYAGFQIEYNQDTFALKTLPVESNLNTSYTFIDGNWKQLQLNGSSYPSHMAFKVYAFDFMPKKGVISDTSEFADVSIYPNPAEDQLQILFKTLPEGDVTCNLFDLSGRLVSSTIYHTPSINLPLRLDNQRGVYFLQVFIANKGPVTFKLLVW